MKKLIVFSLILSFSTLFSQEHFTGLTTSSRGGIMSIGNNPAELANFANKFEVNMYSFSVNISNNKIGFNDIIDGKDIEKLIFQGTEPVNMRFDTEVFGPSVAIQALGWGFAVTSKVNGKLNLVDVDVNIGNAIINKSLPNLLIGTNVNSPYNQRIIGTVWGEVGLSAAKSLINSEKNKVSVGATFKLLFPGTYSNIGIDAFNGTLQTIGNDVYVNNATAGLNVAFSGNLANSFTNFNDYSSSLYGKLNGFVGDIGFNYQRKDEGILDVVKNKNNYKLNLGCAIKNIGTMTFKNDNSFNTNYQLNISPTLPNHPFGQNLSDFSGVDNFSQIEKILYDNNYLTKTPEKKDFVIKLPTTLVLYADLKLISKLYISGYMEQKLTDDSKNDQVTAQNIITVTPRINLGFFEAFIPITDSEISGFNAGFGFRLGGFYLGSGSAITAVLDQKNSKQADFYTGFRWGFL